MLSWHGREGTHTHTHVMDGGKQPEQERKRKRRRKSSRQTREDAERLPSTVATLPKASAVLPALPQPRTAHAGAATGSHGVPPRRAEVLAVRPSGNIVLPRPSQVTPQQPALPPPPPSALPISPRTTPTQRQASTSSLPTAVREEAPLAPGPPTTSSLVTPAPPPMSAEELAKIEDRRRRNRLSSARCYQNRKRRVEQAERVLAEQKRRAVDLFARHLELREENARLKRALVERGGTIPHLSVGEESSRSPVRQTGSMILPGPSRQLVPPSRSGAPDVPVRRADDDPGRPGTSASHAPPTSGPKTATSSAAPPSSRI